MTRPESRLKTAIASAFIVFAATVCAPAAAENQMVEGLVKKVDKSAGKVTLAHGPLTNLGMPAMTMAFRVKDAAWLDRIKAGDRISFMAEQVNEAFTVVHLEKMK